jgi:uncharacterized protein (TIGR00266 family)
MEVEILNRPSFGHLKVRFAPGDSITAESGAMASMTKGVAMKPRMNGGFFRGMTRKVLGGETLFINDFEAPSGGELILTQPWPGDVECVALHDTEMYLQPGAFLACEKGVKMELSFAGFTSLVAREGLFRTKVGGSGRVWFGAVGGVMMREIREELVVDSGHLVAYDSSVDLSLGLPGGVFSSFFGGEGIIARVRGPGRVWLQSRSLDGVAGWTNAYLF